MALAISELTETYTGILISRDDVAIMATGSSMPQGI